MNNGSAEVLEEHRGPHPLNLVSQYVGLCVCVCVCVLGWGAEQTPLCLPAAAPCRETWHPLQEVLRFASLVPLGKFVYVSHKHVSFNQHINLLHTHSHKMHLNSQKRKRCRLWGFKGREQSRHLKVLSYLKKVKCNEQYCIVAVVVLFFTTTLLCKSFLQPSISVWITHT